jgi:glycosyltransferase involved in cell wall biosynthesis
MQMESTDSRALFVVISFEGPDLWSQAGGLGVRVTGLTQTLADLGHETHVFFIGDPALAGEDRQGNLVLHRWGQWISEYHRRGVYDGEEHKRADLNASLPDFVTDRILLPAVREGRVPIVLLEEWQTAECATLISDRLAAAGVRENVIIAWNANNAYSFERIDWPRLAVSTTITTVSRYMRSIIRARGVDALVIPNGIPDRLTLPVSRPDVNRLRSAFQGQQFFFKMARWGQDKGWLQALDAMRLLRERGSRAILVARSGGPTGGGDTLDDAARDRGMRVLPVHSGSDLMAAADEARRDDADVVSLRFGVTEAMARHIFAAADGVLANSVSEPFGLIGLEAMAAGGLVYTGGTGEDYAIADQNAVVLETLEPSEIADRVEEMEREPDRVRRIRRAARQSARNYSWRQTTPHLLTQIEQQGRRQGHELHLVAEPAMDADTGCG